jgi:ribosome-associated translation inhibitor RaiA
MQIQVNTDRSITGGTALTAQVEAAIDAALGRFGDTLTRVEVHLSDENSDQKSGGEDIRCVVEVRPAGLEPIVVRHVGDNVDQALAGAATKMERALRRTLDKLADHN